MDSPALLDVSPAVALLRSIARLEELGWTVADEVGGLRLTNGSKEPLEVRSDLAQVWPQIAHLEAVRRFGPDDDDSLVLGRVANALEVLRVPNAAPERFFGDEVLEVARQAWDRDVGSAMRVPGEWSTNCRLDLGSAFNAPAGVELRVFLSRSPISSIVQETTPASVGRLVPGERRRRVYLALSGDELVVQHFGWISFVGAASLIDGSLLLPPASTPTAQELSLVGQSDAISVPPSAVMHESDATEVTWADDGELLQFFAMVLTWALVASEVRQSETATELEFLGYRRLRLAIPHGGPLIGQFDVEGTLAIHRWAFADEAPDRMVALRQVVSLNSPEEVFSVASDVLDAARLIYVGLRSDAVVEAVSEYRAARTHALDAVRQTAASAQAMVKAAAERSIATFAGTIALFFAHTNKQLTDTQARSAVLLIVALLMALTILSLLVEGPLLGSATKIEEDLDKASPLLSKSELRQIANLPSLAAARKRVRVVRIVVPGLYVAAAVGLIIFGYPQRFG